MINILDSEFASWKDSEVSFTGMKLKPAGWTSVIQKIPIIKDHTNQPNGIFRSVDATAITEGIQLPHNGVFPAFSAIPLHWGLCRKILDSQVIIYFAKDGVGMAQLEFTYNFEEIYREDAADYLTNLTAMDFAKNDE